jgi:uncharacterized membrane protein
VSSSLDYGITIVTFFFSGLELWLVDGLFFMMLGVFNLLLGLKDLLSGDAFIGAPETLFCSIFQ